MISSRASTFRWRSTSAPAHASAMRALKKTPPRSVRAVPRGQTVGVGDVPEEDGPDQIEAGAERAGTRSSEAAGRGVTDRGRRSPRSSRANTPSSSTGLVERAAQGAGDAVVEEQPDVDAAAPPSRTTAFTTGERNSGAKTRPGWSHGGVGADEGPAIAAGPSGCVALLDPRLKSVGRASRAERPQLAFDQEARRRQRSGSRPTRS